MVPEVVFEPTEAYRNKERTTQQTKMTRIVRNVEDSIQVEKTRSGALISGQGRFLTLGTKGGYCRFDILQSRERLRKHTGCIEVYIQRRRIWRF